MSLFLNDFISSFNQYNYFMIQQPIQSFRQINTQIIPHLSKQNQSQCSFISHICNFFIDFIKLYQYSTSSQRLIIILGIILALCSGVSHPIFIFLWCEELELTMNNETSLSEHVSQFRTYLYYFIILGTCVLVFNGLVFTIWKYISRTISRKIRVKYLEHYINQSVVNIQKKNSYQWANRFKMNTLNIQKSIGDKVALLMNLIGIVISGFVSAISIRWTLTLQILIIVPFGIIILIWFIKIQIDKKQIISRAGKQAENKSLQATTMIKTVKMLNGQQKQMKQYQSQLKKGEQQLQSFSWKLGISTGLFYLIQYLFFGVGSIMGIQCIRGTSFCPVEVTTSRYSISNYLQVFFQIFFCTFNFLQLGSNYNSIKSGILSSKQIYSFIEDNPIVQQNLLSQKPSKIGKICFQNVNFSYPLDKNKKIINQLNLQFLQHGFNAIVGATGCGKSTIIQLLLKQYHPQSGSIIINGTINLANINTPYWLSCIGIVTQEPVLFSGTIRENVQVGKSNACDQEIIEALKKANIYDFIKEKQQGLDFEIGVGGSKLSGGQKQRVAIARALIKNPQLLILDEATSALDRTTQRQIQQTLQSIRNKCENLTIICIAHRLKTIQNADRIYLISEGKVLQKGIFKQIKYFQQFQQDNIRKTIINSSLFRTKNNQNILTTVNSKILESKNIKSQIVNDSIYSQLYSYTKQKIWYTICIILALIIGASHAFSGMLLAYSLNQMNMLYLAGNASSWCSTPYPFGTNEKCNSELDKYFDQSEKYLYALIGFAILQFFPYFLQITKLTQIQNQISYNMKNNLYKKLLNLQVKYFQLPQNQSGGAASRFGNDSRSSCQLLTTYIPVLLSNFSTVGIAVAICFSFDWRLGCLSLLVTPMIALSFYIAMIFIGGYEDSSLKIIYKADQIANQLIISIKTAIVLNYQHRLLQKYIRQVEQPLIDIVKVGAKIGLFYGSAYLILDVVVGLALYLTIIIVIDNPSIQALHVIMFMVVSVLSGFITGNNFYFVAHISAGKQAGQRIMQIVSAKTQQQIQRQKFTPTVLQSKSQTIGKIQFRNVSFRYHKDSKPVLKKVSFTIEPGAKVGFVGKSGCGKSTLLQLLLRFYDFQGQILLDGKNIYEYPLTQYRKLFAMLNQQPSLFAGTIEQNIKYNIQVDTLRLKEVSQKSCAYTLDKGESVPDGIKRFLQKKVGPKGSNISGGEKQRVACARALLRQANIFLMDEGTSALDILTQKKVLNGISEQLVGKTMINVAHRIQTIKNSDIIFVFDNGELKEYGQYNQLLERQRYFYNFVLGNRFQS